MIRSEGKMTGLWDIHCHILPGVDDGAADFKEACRMLYKEYKEGVRNVILTPHFRKEMFEPSQDLVKRQYLKLRKLAGELLPDMKLYLGCELHASMEMEQKLQSGEYLTMAGTRYVLVEFRNGSKSSYIKERIRQLAAYGYKPIVAHAERYQAVYGDLEFLEELKDMGALIQMNADSIIGKDGIRMKAFCKKVIRQDLLDFVGTDGHGMKHRIPEVQACFERLEKLMGREYAEEIFIDNPGRIVK